MNCSVWTTHKLKQGEGCHMVSLVRPGGPRTFVITIDALTERASGHYDMDPTVVSQHLYTPQRYVQLVRVPSQGMVFIYRVSRNGPVTGFRHVVNGHGYYMDFATAPPLPLSPRMQAAADAYEAAIRQIQEER